MNKRQQALHAKRLAYVQCFCDSSGNLHAAGKAVLSDLKRIGGIGINASGLAVSPVSGMVDPYAMAYKVGRREVVLRIIGFLNLEETDNEEERPDEPANLSSTSTSEP